MAKVAPHKAVRIDQDTYDALVEVAKEMRVSVTWLVNDTLRKAIEVAYSQEK